jgi:hypothetical protein
MQSPIIEELILWKSVLLNEVRGVNLLLSAPSSFTGFRFYSGSWSVLVLGLEELAHRRDPRYCDGQS